MSRETRREAVTIGGVGLGLRVVGTLEGLLEIPGGDEPSGGIVLAHPHPLYGGTYRQPLIHHTAKACREAGWATLRFNFRGVGRSRGAFHGIEEQDDVRVAASFLRGRLGVDAPLVLGGYSFGSMMTALAAANGEPAHALVLIALVLRWDDMSPDALGGLADFPGPILAVCGERDELAPPGEVDGFLSKLGVDYQLHVVERSDHFFQGRFDEVGAAVSHFLDTRVG